jgi:hypothetical protein
MVKRRQRCKIDLKWNVVASSLVVLFYSCTYIPMQFDKNKICWPEIYQLFCVTALGISFVASFKVI